MLMPYRSPTVATSGRARLLTLLLVLGAALFHLAYLAWWCPLDLAPDEAHYWDWSRHLDWSYYSKGPLVAYLIRGSCALLGDTLFAVRLPAVLCGTLLLTSLCILTVQIYRCEWLACGVVALALTLPVIAVGASLMTIDAPYTCCWGGALVLTHHALFRRVTWAWPAAGLVVGLGILAKYTMVLFLPSVGLFLLFTPAFRRQLLRPGFWVMSLVAAVCCLPILIWNIQHDGVTLRHVGRQAGSNTGAALFWSGPLIFVGTQAALLLGYWFIGWVAAMVAHRPWRERDDGVRYLWWTSAVMFGIFLAFSVKTRGGEPNWPITAYISGLVLTAGWLSRRLEESSGWARRLQFGGLALACLAGTVLTLVIHRTDLVYPLLARAAGEPTAAQPLPLRRFDPTCRLRGWRTLAAAVDRWREQLRAEGDEPLLAGTGWAMPGEIGFYCAGQPTVYSVGPALGDRHSQYDLWRPNPIDDAEAFQGRTFLVIGVPAPGLGVAFDRVDPPCLVTHFEAGHPVAQWMVTVCRGFRGFPRADGPESY